MIRLLCKSPSSFQDEERACRSWEDFDRARDMATSFVVAPYTPAHSHHATLHHTRPDAVGKQELHARTIEHMNQHDEHGTRDISAGVDKTRGTGSRTDTVSPVALSISSGAKGRRCQVCKSSKRGGCGTNRAISRCLVRIALLSASSEQVLCRDVTSKPKPLPTPGKTAVDAPHLSRSKPELRCSVCKKLKKGRCGTAAAVRRCLWHPKERLKQVGTVPASVKKVKAAIRTPVHFVAAAPDGSGNATKDSTAVLQVKRARIGWRHEGSTPHKSLRAKTGVCNMHSTVGALDVPSAECVSAGKTLSLYISSATHQNATDERKVRPVLDMAHASTGHAASHGSAAAGLAPSYSRAQSTEVERVPVDMQSESDAETVSWVSQAKSGTGDAEMATAESITTAEGFCLGAVDSKRGSTPTFCETVGAGRIVSRRCEVCVSRKQGNCGTVNAIGKCMWRPEPPSTRALVPARPVSCKAAAALRNMRRYKALPARRCAVCAVQKKGNCGTDKAIPKCLWRPTSGTGATVSTASKLSTSSVETVMSCVETVRGRMGEAEQGFRRARVAPTPESTESSERGLRRCAVCSACKKGGCGTAKAVRKCLRRPRADESTSRKPRESTATSNAPSPPCPPSPPPLPVPSTRRLPLRLRTPAGPSCSVVPSPVVATRKRCAWCKAYYKPMCGTSQAAPGCLHTLLECQDQPMTERKSRSVFTDCVSITDETMLSERPARATSPREASTSPPRDAAVLLNVGGRKASDRLRGLGTVMERLLSLGEHITGQSDLAQTATFPETVNHLLWMHTQAQNRGLLSVEFQFRETQDRWVQECLQLLQAAKTTMTTDFAGIKTDWVTKPLCKLLPQVPDDPIDGQILRSSSLFSCVTQAFLDKHEDEAGSGRGSHSASLNMSPLKDLETLSQLVTHLEDGLVNGGGMKRSKSANVTRASPEHAESSASRFNTENIDMCTASRQANCLQRSSVRSAEALSTFPCKPLSKSVSAAMSSSWDALTPPPKKRRVLPDSPPLSPSSV